MELLNGEIMALDGCLELQEAVCLACEAYFFHGGLRREAAVTLAFPFRVMRAMETGKVRGLETFPIECSNAIYGGTIYV